MRLLFSLFIVLFCSTAQAQNWNQLDEQGKKHGPWRGFHEKSNFLRYEGEFKNGLEIGEFKFYEDSKAKRIIATRNFSAETPGKVHTTFYNQKFKVSEGTEMNRKREGEWVYYHNKSTKVMMREHYKNGILEGAKTVYFHNDKVAEESFYKNGKLHGSYKKFAHNGVLLESSNYEDGLKHGSIVIRDGDDKITIEGQYKQDKAVGIWKYYQNGKLEKVVDNDNPSIKRIN
jgi:antitoxin component YwqK of YwqJK toxin-antitoxin module